MPSTPDSLARHGHGPTQRTRGCAALLVIAAVASATTVRATSITVPDEAPTVQAGMDAGVDTVWIRAGVYSETPAMTKRVSLMGVQDASGRGPVLNGLTFQNDGGSNVPVRISNLSFKTRVEVLGEWSSELPTVTFEACELEAGFMDQVDDYSERVFRRCRVVGSIEYFEGGALVVDSCEVEGSVRAQHDDCQLTVTRSRFRGSGISGSVGHAHVSDNVLEQGSVVISANLNAVILNNHLLSSALLYVASQDGNAEVSGNRLENGRVYADANQDLRLENNVVLNSPNVGMYVLVTSSAIITRNLVTGSASHGFYIGGNDPWRLDVTNNTSVYNHGCGFLSDGGYWNSQYTFTGNIGARNDAHGVRWDGPDVSTVRYNNWFENGLGDVLGRPSSIQDLTSDPLFCDASNGDFRLSSASPLANIAGYGRAGALGIGCAAPGVFQDAFRLSRLGPNPSAGPVNIEFEMPRAASIDVDVFDVQGRLVASPARGNMPAGKHSVSWAGANVSPGLYLVRYRFPGGEERRRLVRTP